MIKTSRTLVKLMRQARLPPGESADTRSHLSSPGEAGVEFCVVVLNKITSSILLYFGMVKTSRGLVKNRILEM